MTAYVPALPYAPRPSGVQDVLSRIDQLSIQPVVTLRDIVRVVGDAAHLPLVMVPALLIASPLSGIPLLPTVLGALIALVAGQALIGRRRIWLPQTLLARNITGSRLHRAILALRGGAGWLDRHARTRFAGLVQGPAQLVALLLILLAALMMPLLEFVPLSSSILGLAITAIATGLLVTDGLFVLLGFVLMGLAAMIPLGLISGALSLLS